MSAGATVAIDPHVHSEGSYDAKEPVELLLKQARDIGLDAIVVTDHDTISESLRAAELAPEYGLIGIPGVEVSTAAGHLLAIGVEERPEPHRPLADTVETVRDLGGVAVVPHPFQRTRHGVRRGRITDCDAIEVYNAWIFTGYRNRRARQFAVRNDYPGIAASDAHSAKYLGRAYTELTVEDANSPADLDSDRIVEALADGDAEIHGRRQPFHRSVRHYLKGAGKKVGRGVVSSAPSFVKL
jgi:predicted metal-dependent phosphoesterase TrpH